MWVLNVVLHVTLGLWATLGLCGDAGLGVGDAVLVAALFIALIQLLDRLEDLSRLIAGSPSSMSASGLDIAELSSGNAAKGGSMSSVLS